MISLEPLDLASQPNPDYDVLIVGAGMVGATLAAALGQTSLKIGLIEARSLPFGSSGFGFGPGSDGRASALALGSMRMLTQLGVWSIMQDLGVSPIDRIQVSDGQFGHYVHLERELIQAEALGYVVENWVTQTGLYQVLSTYPQIDWICPARLQAIDSELDTDREAKAAEDPEESEGLKGSDEFDCNNLTPSRLTLKVEQAGQIHTLQTRLLIGADGSRSSVRQLAGIPVTSWEYGQVCLVTTVTTEHPHQQVAYERFQPSGPFAILPMIEPATQGSSPTSTSRSSGSHRSCVVWTIRAHDQDHLLSLSDEDFIAAISPSFGSHLGRILSVGSRSSYQPRRLHADRYIGSRLALVGDAAHATHPVGGQGLNMGMRDVAALANLLLEADRRGFDPGNPALLTTYQRSRQLENRAFLFATDTANRLFSNTNVWLQLSRRFGLVTTDHIPRLKAFLMRSAMGIAPYQPQLQLYSSRVGITSHPASKTTERDPETLVATSGS